MIECPNCHYMNDEGTKFCIKCGTKLEPVQEKHEEPIKIAANSDKKVVYETKYTPGNIVSGLVYLLLGKKGQIEVTEKDIKITKPGWFLEGATTIIPVNKISGSKVWVGFSKRYALSALIIFFFAMVPGSFSSLLPFGGLASATGPSYGPNPFFIIVAIIVLACGFKNVIDIFDSGHTIQVPLGRLSFGFDVAYKKRILELQNAIQQVTDKNNDNLNLNLHQK